MGSPGPKDVAPAFRADLQGLRAVAILLVVFCHAGVPYVGGGFVGVDVFFVLSGYLITGLLVRELIGTARIELIAFYARRLRRLLPALVVMLMLTGVAAIWILSGREAYSQLASAPYAATWTSNLYFALSSVDYFDELADRDLFLHTWSLGVEEQFYLVWPLLLAVLWAVGRAGGRRRGMPAAALPLLALMLVAGFGASLYWTFVAPNSAYYMMPSRIWQFTLGAIVCLSDRNLSRRSATLFSIIGLGLILLSATLLSSRVSYPGYWALAPSIGAALTIASGRRWGSGRALAHPALVWIGDRSYSWYLWHWPILMLGYSLGLEGQAVAVSGMVLLSLLAAILSYRFVELPFWKGRFRTAPAGRTVLTSVLAMVLTIAVLFNGQRFYAGPAQTEGLRADVPVIYSMGCDSWYVSAEVQPCTLGPEQAPRTVVLLGDSIGAQWFSAIPEIFTAPEWRTVVLTKSSCAIVDEDFVYERIGGIYEVCAQWRDAALDEITLMKPDVVVIGNALTYDFDATQWTEGSARVFSRLDEAVTTVFAIVGTPNLGFHGPGCVSRNHAVLEAADGLRCTSHRNMDGVERVKAYLSEAASRFPGVYVLDFSRLICPRSVCSAVSRDGVLVFRDSQHLTDTFVRTMVPGIRERFWATGALAQESLH